MSQEQNPDMLAHALEECHIEEKVSPNVILSETCDPSILAKFPIPKPKVPPIFLHNPIKFIHHVRKVLSLGIKFYQPVIGHHYSKICCQTYDDHKALVQYFDQKELPFHTFGHHEKRKMIVVFRGLPKNIDLQNLKKELEAALIPVDRVHEMKNSDHAKDLDLLVLVVVPNNEQGRKILQVQKLFGHKIKIEPRNPRHMQCYYCQKWGHSQRFCHGRPKCVKCSGDHLSKDCTRDPETQSPKCANCGADHTSNYKLCPYSPDSPEYIKRISVSALRKITFSTIPVLPRKLVTIHNCHQSFIRKARF